MYLQRHPYTGQDLRILGPSPYANLGLGMSSPEAGEGIDSFTGAIVMKNPFNPGILDKIRLAQLPPYLQRRIRNRAITRYLTPGNTPSSAGVTGLGDNGDNVGTDTAVYDPTAQYGGVFGGSAQTVNLPVDLTGAGTVFQTSSGGLVYGPLSSIASGIQSGGANIYNVLSSAFSAAGQAARTALTPGGSYQTCNAQGVCTSYTGTGVAPGIFPGINTGAQLAGALLNPSTLMLLGVGIVGIIILESVAK